MLVKIRRQKGPETPAYWQTFAFEGPRDLPVSAMLESLNARDDLRDAEGRPAERIRWECSCLQKMCGACAMVINGIPALACETFLRDLSGDAVMLEPLSKFPVIADLAVDRGIIHDSLRDGGIYLGHYRAGKKPNDPRLYSAARCLKCGLCLEACPNYARGIKFFGAAFANESFLCASVSEDRAGEISKTYAEYFAGGCSKVLACNKVCPMGIDTLSSIAGMTRIRKK